MLKRTITVFNNDIIPMPDATLFSTNRVRVLS